MIKIAPAARAASVILPPSDCPATARANIAAQIAGLMSEIPVMMAWSCSCTVVPKIREIGLFRW